MEYDRALFRVYERAMEDLIATASVFANNDDNERDNGDGGYGDGGDGEGDDNGQGRGQGQGQIMQRHRNSRARTRTRTRTNDGMIPFLWPLFLQRYIIAANDLYANGALRGFLLGSGSGNGNENGWRRNLNLNLNFTSSSSSLGNGHGNGNGNSRWGIFRRRRTRNFMRLSGQDEEVSNSGSGDDEEMGMGTGGMNDAGVEMATLSRNRNADGLRRRNPSHDSTGSNSSSRTSSSHTASSSSSSTGGGNNNNRPRTILSNIIMDDNENEHASIDDSSQDGRQGTQSRSDEEDTTMTATRTRTRTTTNNTTTPTPTTEMAQRIAAAQRQRNIHRQRRRRQQQQQQQTQTGGCTQKGLHSMMRVSMVIAIWHLFVLLSLHYTYVGPRIAKVEKIHFDDVIDGVPLSTARSKGKIVKSTCLENALMTRPVEERSQFFTMFGEDVKEDGKAEEEVIEEEDVLLTITNTNENSKNQTSPGQHSNNNTSTSSVSTSPPLLGRDEILQIKIIYNNDDCHGCSRVRNVTIPSSNNNVTTNGTENNDETTTTTTTSTRSRSLWSTSTTLISRSMGLDSVTNKEGEEEEEVDRYSTLDYWNENVYKFSTNEALMYLDDKLLFYHNVSIVNVTLTERCLSTGSDEGEYSLMSKFAKHMAQIYGMDSVIINQFMYSIKTTDGKFRNGHLQKMETKERWMYSKYQLEESYEVRHNILFWFFNRIGVLAISLAAFFLVTSVTALIVRELTSAGVMVMFPIFASLRAWGIPGANDRVLEMSYPWVGRARRAINRARIHPFEHYIWAHLAKLGLMYTLYESSQVAWSAMLYSKSTPANLPLWIFGNSMIYEYFNMIFVRSALSAYFYPRMTLLYFLGYHIYFYSVPYGFFDVGLIPWVLLMVHTMIYTVIALEVPASSRGAVSIESPREVFAKLSWPEWSANIPAEWTLFLPLNARYIPIHDRRQVQGGMMAATTVGEENDGATETTVGTTREDDGTTTDSDPIRDD